MGSITEVWKNGHEWLKFHTFLEQYQPEGVDSSGVAMKLSRYANFLKLYVSLFYAEKCGDDPQTLLKLVLEIKNDPEGFFDTERCLKCIDANVRQQVMTNLKSLKSKSKLPGAWVYQPAYSPVLDKLNYMLGLYHTSKDNK